MRCRFKLLVLLCLGAGPAAAQLNVTLTAMSFTPSIIAVGGTSTLSITFGNATAATINDVTFNDALPAGITSNTFGLSTFSPGCVFQSNVALDSITIYGKVSVAAHSSCTVQAVVNANASGVYGNGAANISTWNGNPLAFQDTILLVPGPANYQGLWWVPNGVESGWGLNFAHHGDQVYATWYTYDTSGKAWWLSMLAGRTTPTGNTYTGKIYIDVGPSFNNYTGTALAVPVGDGTLTFSDADNGSFSYNINGVAQTKPIQRFDLVTGPQPVCVYGATTPNLAVARNYQDLWWVPNGVESGWGLNLAHQGDSIYLTWYTYGVDDQPLWLSALVQFAGGNVYTGKIYQNSGSRFDIYDETKVVATPVGTATLSFADGNHASFGYSVMIAPFTTPIVQSKPITRFPFSGGGATFCQ